MVSQIVFLRLSLHPSRRHAYINKGMETLLTNEQIVERFSDHGVRATAMRLLVWRTLWEQKSTMTLRELEDALCPADRSTIFRTLTLFQEHHLVHCIDDGSGSTRYEACMSEHHCTPEDQHVHFHCRVCGRTLCLNRTPVPVVGLPEGFVAETVNCVVSGVCPDCEADDSPVR